MLFVKENEIPLSYSEISVLSLDNKIWHCACIFVRSVIIRIKYKFYNKHHYTVKVSAYLKLNRKQLGLYLRWKNNITNTGIFINNFTLSKFYCKKTNDAIGKCSVSSDVETSAPRSEGAAGRDNECSPIDLYGRPGENEWWTRINNWRVQGHTRCSHWESVGSKRNFESFCIQRYAICLNCIISILAIKFWKC
jgi:hypothetical protein